jgi:hypothetical protein
MGRAKCTYLADEKCTKIWSENWRRRDSLEEIRVNGKTILKFVA